MEIHDSIDLPIHSEVLKIKCQQFRSEANNRLKYKESNWQSKHINILEQLLIHKYDDIAVINDTRTKEQKEEVLNRYRQHVTADILTRCQRSGAKNSQDSESSQDSSLDEAPSELKELESHHWEDVKVKLKDEAVSIKSLI